MQSLFSVLVPVSREVWDSHMTFIAGEARKGADNHATAEGKRVISFDFDSALPWAQYVLLPPIPDDFEVLCARFVATLEGI